MSHELIVFRLKNIWLIALINSTFHFKRLLNFLGIFMVFYRHIFNIIFMIFKFFRNHFTRPKMSWINFYIKKKYGLIDSKSLKGFY